MKKKRRLLLIEPHSDDGIISAGGFLEKFKEDYEYHFVLVVASNLELNHNKDLSRNQRLEEFASYVNHFKGFWHCDTKRNDALPLDMDCKLDLFPRAKLVAHIEKIINHVCPDVLFTIGPSFHHDHTAVFESVIAATRPTARHFPSEFYILENPTYVHSNPIKNFVPDTYVTLSESEIDKKLICFKKCFPSQIRESKNALSIEGIKSWARYRGIEARSTYAEAFQTFSRII